MSGNKFVNDGSFLEMFKKQMQQQKEKTEQNTLPDPNRTSKTKKMKEEDKTDQQTTIREEQGFGQFIQPTDVNSKPEMELTSTKTLPIVGKRKAPKSLKTGMVEKKAKKDEEEETNDKDPWSKYLSEVRKYKSQKCIEDDGGTPLVK